MKKPRIMQKRVCSFFGDLAVTERDGKFYALVWDNETMNLILDSKADSRAHAEQLLADFLLDVLRGQ